MYTAEKEHQRNRLCVNLSTPSLIFILVFSYGNYSVYKTIAYYLLYIYILMKLFLAHIKFLKYKWNQSIDRNQLLLLPTAYLKGFSWYFVPIFISSKFYQLRELKPLIASSVNYSHYIGIFRIKFKWLLNVLWFTFQFRFKYL